MTTTNVYGWGRVAGSRAAVILCVLGLTVSAAAQGPALPPPYPGAMLPGAIGSQPLAGGEPMVGFFQSVEIRAPRGALISLAEGGRFPSPQAGPLRVGMLVGQPYRISVINLPSREGLEVFPTIEVVDRLHTPRGQETRFPVIVELTLEDLNLALDGKFVTRVVYLEDPLSALPTRQDPGAQSWFDVRPGTDPGRRASVRGRCRPTTYPSASTSRLRAIMEVDPWQAKPSP